MAPLNFRIFLSNPIKLGRVIKGFELFARMSIRPQYHLSVRRESQNRATGIFSDLTVFLTLRYHYEYYVTSENHYFDLVIV